MAIGTGAAILGAAALGTGASLIGGAQGAKAAGKAADVQGQAALAGVAVQRDAAVQSRIDAYPWALAGAQALYAYMGELGVPMPKTPILPDLNQGPFAAGPAQNALGTSLGTGKALGGQTNLKTSIQNWYGQHLGRRPSDQEVNAWMTGYAGGDPGRIQSDIASSPEARAFKARGGSPLAPVASAGTTTAQPAIPSPQNMAMTERKGFQQTPGYQFQVEEGEKGVINNLSALGMKNSGAALKALTRFRTGIASQEYNNYLNRLQGAAGMGQTQVNSNNAGMQNAAGNIAQGYGDVGAARASGYVGQANAWGNALGNISNTAGNALGWYAYMNKPATGGA